MKTWSNSRKYFGVGIGAIFGCSIIAFQNCSGFNASSLTSNAIGLLTVPLTGGTGLCNIKDFGARGDGISDDTAAIQNASSSCGGRIFVPASSSCYLFNGTLNFTGLQFDVKGEGPDQSCIKNTSANMPTISMNSTMGGYIYGMRFTRLPAAAIGGDGIFSQVAAENFHLWMESVNVDHNYIGLNLGMSTWGTISHILTSDNVSHGMVMSGMPTQWQLFTVTSRNNGGDGLRVESGGQNANGGEINEFHTSNNGGNGMTFTGGGNVLTDIRVKNCVLNGDRGFGIYFDLGGGMGEVVSCNISGEGRGGFYSTDSTATADLSDTNITGNTGHGVEMHARRWQVKGGDVSGNIGGSGIFGVAGYGRVVNTRAANNSNCGVYIDSAITGASIMPRDTSGNGICPTSPTASTSNVFVSTFNLSLATSPAAIPYPSLNPPTTGLCNIKRYGAVGNGSTDDTAAILAASAACSGRILIPSSNGCYMFNGTLSFSGQSFAVVGEGPYQSCIKNTAAGSPTILANNTNSGYVYGVRLLHSTATNGGDGIRTTGTDNANIIIQNVLAETNYVGLNLGSVSSGTVAHIIVGNNLSHGVAMVGSPLKWDAFNIASGVNGGDGLFVQGQGPTEFGVVDALQTYNNSGHGAEFLGSGGPLTGVKMRNCFVGEDLKYGIYLDTLGGNADIMACQFEGEAYGGLLATASNQNVNVSDSVTNITFGHGIEMRAAHWQVVGGNISLNHGSGIYAAGGVGSIVNVRTSENQGCGVYVEPALAGINVIAVDAHDNAVCPISPAASTAGITITGTVPN